MTDIRTPQGPGDDSGNDDPRLIEALRALGRAESSRPDEVTRRRHLRAMSRARLARRPYAAVAAAAAVVALVAGAAIVGSGGGNTPGNSDLARNAALTDDTVAPVVLPEFPSDSPITPVPFERTEEHVILKVSKDQAATIEKELAASLGGNVPVVGKTSKATTFVVPASVAKKISDTTGVSAFPDSPVAAVAEQSPVPSWGLDRIDALDAPFDDKYSWSNAGSGSIVYVIDTGVYSGHSDLSGRVVSGYTAVADGNGTEDCHGHGTHVAGTVAGNQYGVAKSASVVAVRVLDCNGSGYTSGVVAGINWVVANHPGGPGIINMSLGGPANSALDTAVSDATAAGIVVAVAAGNSSDDACAYSPARAPSALTIGATDNTDARAYYSNTGSCVDMWAPGSQITSAWIGGAGSSRTISGTSMASPHVAGLAARLLSMNPSMSVSDIRSRLVRKSGSATTPIVNLVEEPADVPVTTTTAPATTVPESTTTVVDAPTTTTEPAPVTTTTAPVVTTTTPVVTTTVPGATTTTVPPSTLPKRGRSDEAPGRSRKVSQPKQFALTWDARTATASLVASWTVETIPDRYSMECEGVGRKSEDTTLEFEQTAVTVNPNGRSQTTLLIAPKTAMKCKLTAFIGSDESRDSNTAVIPPAPRRPAVTTTTTAPVVTTTVPVVTTTTPAPETTTTVPSPENTTPAPTTVPESTTTVPGATTTIAPAGGKPAPVTTVRPAPAPAPSPVTTVRPAPTTTVKPAPAPARPTTTTTVKGRKKDD